MEKKDLHPRIKRFYETYCVARGPQKSDSPADLVQANKDRRAARLKAVARELRKIGYIVMENSSGTGLVIIERGMQGTDPPG